MSYLNGIEKNLDDSLHSLGIELTNDEDISVMESDLLTQAISKIGAARTLIKTAKLSMRGAFEVSE